MKTISKILLFFWLLFLWVIWVSAWAFNLPENSDISDVSINASTETDITSATTNIGISLLTSAKIILQWVLLIYIVYIGAQMVFSMWTDEDQLSQAKRQIRYMLVALVFINIPGTLFNALYNDTETTSIDTGTISSSSWFNSDTYWGNLFVNISNFFDPNGTGVLNGLINFLEVTAAGIAVFVIILAGIKILTSRGRDDQISEGKNKIVWSIIGLMSIGFIEVWKSVIYEGEVEGGANLFGTLAELSLFFAGPTAIIFLTLAAYYYITSNGDEEKVKKAKSIVINTVVATVILLASYTFLLDLANL